MSRTPSYLWPLDRQRTHEPIGHQYHPPTPCADCGQPVPDMHGQTRGSVKRCGRCDIVWCDGADEREHAAWLAQYQPKTNGAP